MHHSHFSGIPLRPRHTNDSDQSRENEDSSKQRCFTRQGQDDGICQSAPQDIDSHNAQILAQILVLNSTTSAVVDRQVQKCNIKRRSFLLRVSQLLDPAIYTSQVPPPFIRMANLKESVPPSAIVPSPLTSDGGFRSGKAHQVGSSNVAFGVKRSISFGKIISQD